MLDPNILAIIISYSARKLKDLTKFKLINKHCNKICNYPRVYKHIQVHLSVTNKFSNNKIEDILQTSKHIQKIIIAQKKINILIPNLCDNKTINLITLNCQNLTFIDMSNCYRVTDDAVINLAISCVLLTNLNISGNKQLTDISVNAITTYSKNLISFKLAGCIELTDKSIQNIANLTKLKVLNICYLCNITDTSLVKIANSCKLINNIQLHSCKITKRSIDALSNNKYLQTLVTCCNDLSHLHTLKSLKEFALLDNIRNLLENIQTKDEDLKNIALCTTIEALYFSNLSKVTDKGMSYISKQINIKSITIQNLKNITDECFKDVSFIKLILLNNDQLTDKAILYLTTNNRLKELSIRHCKNFTNSIFSSLILLDNLKYLRLEFCKQITMIGISDYITKMLELYNTTSKIALKYIKVDRSFYNNHITHITEINKNNIIKIIK